MTDPTKKYANVPSKFHNVTYAASAEERHEFDELRGAARITGYPVGRLAAAAVRCYLAWFREQYHEGEPFRVHCAGLVTHPKHRGQAAPTPAVADVAKLPKDITEGEEQ